MKFYDYNINVLTFKSGFEPPDEEPQKLRKGSVPNYYQYDIPAVRLHFTVQLVT